MERTPEPELMLDPVQARAYARADFAQPHDSFVTLLAKSFPALDPEHILDLGCGPGDISRRIARRYPGCRVVGVDGSEAMLEEGRLANQREGLEERVFLQWGYLPGLPVFEHRFSAVVSNSLLHHLIEPHALWKTIEELATNSTPIFIMDLLRPASAEVASDLVAKYAKDEPDILREDFENSLHAAYRPEEIRAQLKGTGLEALAVDPIGDRHMIIHGTT